MAMPELHRGDVWIVNLGYKEKARPWLILSVPVNDVERNLVTGVSRTTSDRPGSRFEIRDSSDLFPDRPGVFDAQSVHTIERAVFRTARKIGRLSHELLAEVETAVKRWLGFIDEQH